LPTYIMCFSSSRGIATIDLFPSSFFT
jgi:hypothetical protein